jgi:hypothetical protein
VTDLARSHGKRINFDVNSHSNKMPGGGRAMIAAHTPYIMAAKYVLERNSSLRDIERAAQRIANELEKLAQTQKSILGD